jgi:hypothetical protein
MMEVMEVMEVIAKLGIWALEDWLFQRRGAEDQRGKEVF